MDTLFPFKCSMLLFWGLWYLTAFFTNLCESFQASGVLRKAWLFASGNLQAVTQATKTYSASRWLPRLLFFGVLFWQFLIVFMFAWAITSSVMAGSLNAEAVNAAFAAGIGLWAAFMIADEILKQYDTEHPHVLFFIAQLVTFLALEILPS